MYQLTGLVKVINNTQEISEKFKKREFVVTDSSGQYPQDILLQLTQDRVNLIDGYQVGQQVTVAFNLRGREWTNKEGKVMFFNSLDAWKIEAPVDTNSAPPTMDAPSVETVASGDDDDLPF